MYVMCYIVCDSSVLHHVLYVCMLCCAIVLCYVMCYLYVMCYMYVICYTLRDSIVMCYMYVMMCDNRVLRCVLYVCYVLHLM